MATKTAISVHVFKNGDPHYTGRRFVINQKQTRNFESFLTMVTTGVRPSYGAVRRLYTPNQGHRIDDLGTLQDNNFYVAAGLERFKKVQYFSIGRPGAAQKTKARVIKPVQHSRIQASAKFKKPLDRPKVIHVYRNGDILYPAVRMLLTKRMLMDWQVVYTAITDKVNLVSGAVRKLYHMDGRLVTELSEIENDECYVAAGKEKFKKVAYGIMGPLEPSSPRIKRPAPPQIKPKNSKITPRPNAKPKVPPIKETPKKAPPTQPKKEKRKKEKTPLQKEAETVFHSKPAIVKRSREKNTDTVLEYEDDNNNVFKAKEERKETKGAREVNETNETAVDLPIDQVEAEEVEEEIPPQVTNDPPLEDQYPSAEEQYPPEDPYHQEDQYPPAEDQYPPAEEQYPPVEDQYQTDDQYPPNEEQYQPSEQYPPSEGGFQREQTIVREEGYIEEESFHRAEPVEEEPPLEETPREQIPYEDPVEAPLPQETEDLIQERLEEVEETRQEGYQEEEQVKSKLKSHKKRKSSQNTNQNNSSVDLNADRATREGTPYPSEKTDRASSHSSDKVVENSRDKPKSGTRDLIDMNQDGKNGRSDERDGRQISFDELKKDDENETQSGASELDRKMSSGEQNVLGETDRKSQIVEEEESVIEKEGDSGVLSSNDKDETQLEKDTHEARVETIDRDKTVEVKVDQEGKGVTLSNDVEVQDRLVERVI